MALGAMRLRLKQQVAGNFEAGWKHAMRVLQCNEDQGSAAGAAKVPKRPRSGGVSATWQGALPETPGNFYRNAILRARMRKLRNQWNS
mgnify:CR=1 FL=1